MTRLAARAAHVTFYGLAIGAWLLLPLALFASEAVTTSSETSRRVAAVYAAVAVAVGWCAWRVLRVEIQLEPKWRNEV